MQTYLAFPLNHRRQIHSTNVLEGLDGKLARRSEVVGVFANVQAMPRLLGTLVDGQQDQ